MRSVARDRWTILDADSCAVRTLRLLCATLFFVRRKQEQRRANDRLGIGNDSPRRVQRFHSHA